MDHAHQERLFAKFPRIFQERTFPAGESAMARGLEVGDGWCPLIDELCTQLQRLTDLHGAPQVVATQVKEKFGSLRFDTHACDPRQVAAIACAQELSVRTCDVCGAPGRLISLRRTAVVRCPSHEPGHVPD